MKFEHQVITDLTDAQRNFEQITAHGIDDATALGGDLSGTLPNPALSAQGLHKGLQLFTAADLKLQLGQASFTTTNAGWQTFTVTFPSVFPTALAVCLCSVQTNTGAGVLGSDTRTVSTSGFLLDVNTPSVENIVAHWIAIGH